ncbi:hypothetical protein FQN50_007200 [Emmonsiellopsis sp. PD_5]|nr:hypothetical protein FQN50_007200 [Emmonsiellopsis sp. PD_5]
MPYWVGLIMAEDLSDGLHPPHHQRLTREQVYQIEKAMEGVNPPFTKQFLADMWPGDFATTGRKRIKRRPTAEQALAEGLTHPATMAFLVNGRKVASAPRYQGSPIPRFSEASGQTFKERFPEKVYQHKICFEQEMNGLKQSPKETLKRELRSWGVGGYLSIAEPARRYLLRM